MNEPEIATDPTVPDAEGETGPLDVSETGNKRRRVHVPAPRTNLVVGEPLPYQLSTAELIRALNIKAGVFYKRQRQGAYRRFEFRNPTDPHKRFSGVLVTKYLKAGK